MPARGFVDQIQAIDPQARIVVAGDLNECSRVLFPGSPVDQVGWQ